MVGQATIKTIVPFPRETSSTIRQHVDRAGGPRLKVGGLPGCVIESPPRTIRGEGHAPTLRVPRVVGEQVLLPGGWVYQIQVAALVATQEPRGDPLFEPRGYCPAVARGPGQAPALEHAQGRNQRRAGVGRAAEDGDGRGLSQRRPPVHHAKSSLVP